MTEDKNSKLYALLIGINSYIDSRDLYYCVNDAIAIKNQLEDNQYSPFDTVTTILLVDNQNTEFQPLKSNIEEYIDTIVEQADFNDTILIYFAGHGDEVEQEPALLPSDFRRGRGLNSAIKIENIKEKLMKSNASFKLLLLDSCHSGSVEGRSESGQLTQHTLDVINDAPEGFSIISSCGLHQLSYEDDELKHGIFTYYLLEGMKGKADGNRDSIVTINELYDYLATNVKERVFKRYTKTQIPHCRSNYSGIATISKIEEIKNSSPTSDLYPFKNIQLNHRKFTDPMDENINRILLDLRKVYGYQNLSDDGSNITFPNGRVERTYMSGDQKSIYLFLDYQIETKKQVNLLLTKLSNYFRKWESISFYSPYIIDLNKLDKYCIDNNIEIQQFSLKSPKNISFRTDHFTKEINYDVAVYNFKEQTKITYTNGNYLHSEFYKHIDQDKLKELIDQIRA